MDDLVAFVMIALLAVAGVLVLLMVGALLNRARLRRKAHLPDDQRLALQAALLEAIKDRSSNQRTIVDIRPFWRRSGVRSIQRNAVIDPLIESGDVFVPHDSSGSEAWDVVTGWWNVALYRPPTRLVLSDRTWTRMVHEGVSGQSIVIGTFVERTNEVNDFSINTGGGDNIGSPVGRNVRVRDVDVSKYQETAGLSGEDLKELVTALRADALNFADPDQRSQVRALADKLEDESDAEEPDEDTVDGMINRARRLAEGSAGLMSATHRVFEAWQQFHDR
jgi:hypothetical protein